MEMERFDVGELQRVSRDPHGNAMESFEAFEADYVGARKVEQGWLAIDRPVEAQEWTDVISKLEQANPGYTVFYNARQTFLETIAQLDDRIYHSGSGALASYRIKALEKYKADHPEFTDWA